MQKIHETTICSEHNVNFFAFKRNTLCVRKHLHLKNREKEENEER